MKNYSLYSHRKQSILYKRLEASDNHTIYLSRDTSNVHKTQRQDNPETQATYTRHKDRTIQRHKQRTQDTVWRQIKQNTWHRKNRELWTQVKANPLYSMYTMSNRIGL
jgi:L-rhamnose mutarotase